jgi:hypothetical protein
MSGFARCHFLPFFRRDDVPAGALVHDVSSYAEMPYRTLSPFYAHGGIPVPGMPGTTSDTVEGIWQGLKVIRGRTAPRLFQGPGRTRGGGKPSGHHYGGTLLGAVEARYKIYRVAYEWVLALRVDPRLIRRFVDVALGGTPQYFHDTGDKGTSTTRAHRWRTPAWWPSTSTGSVPDNRRADMTTVGRAYIGVARRHLADRTGRIKHCVGQLDDGQVWWRPHESMNSVGNILLHVCGNLRQWVVAGVAGAPDTRDRPAEFAERGPIPKSELVRRLEAVVTEADAALAALDETRLLEPRRVQGFDETVMSAIWESLTHLSGHTQEVVYVTRLQLGDRYRFAWAPSTPEQGAPA